MIKKILILLILLEAFTLGFYLGQTHIVKLQIQKQQKCVAYVYNKDINLQEFYGQRIELNSIFIHAQAAIALKYENCMWSKDE